LKETFRPEFLNRVDEIIVFNHLTKDELKQIVDLMFKDVVEEVENKKMTVKFQDGVREFILEKGYDPKYGARPLRRTIQRYIEDELADMYLKGLLAEGCSIVVSVRDGNIVFNVEKPAENAVVDTENSTTDNMKTDNTTAE